MASSDGSASASDLFLFVLTAFIALWCQKSSVVMAASSVTNDATTTTTTNRGAADSTAMTCDATTTTTTTTGEVSKEALSCVENDNNNKEELKNVALIFVKPHANTEATRKLVVSRLQEAGLQILSQTTLDGPTIESQGLIDLHYYAIASRATLFPISEIHVPSAQFEEAFGESWDLVLEENRAANAMEACQRFSCTPDELNQAWNKATSSTKLGGGFYCSLVSVRGQPSLYVLNGFFPVMRQKFIQPDVKLYCLQVEWDPRQLSWQEFRRDLVGPTDPTKAPKDSIRRLILDRFQELGLKTEPNKSDNGIHASASPFEAMSELANWLKQPMEQSAFGKALLERGISQQTLVEWSRDARIQLTKQQQQMGSVFDTLEDLNVQDCLERMVELNQLNNKQDMESSSSS